MYVAHSRCIGYHLLLNTANNRFHSIDLHFHSEQDTARLLELAEVAFIV